MKTLNEKLTFTEAWALLPEIIDVPYEVNGENMKALLLMSKSGIFYAYMENEQISQNGGVAYCFYDRPPEDLAKLMVKCLRDNNIIK